MGRFRVWPLGNPYFNDPEQTLAAPAWSVGHRPYEGPISLPLSPLASSPLDAGNRNMNEWATQHTAALVAYTTETMFVTTLTVFKGILIIGFDYTTLLEIHLVRNLALALIGAYRASGVTPAISGCLRQ